MLSVVIAVLLVWFIYIPSNYIPQLFIYLLNTNFHFGRTTVQTTTTTAQTRERWSRRRETKRLYSIDKFIDIIMKLKVFFYTLENTLNWTTDNISICNDTELVYAHQDSGGWEKATETQEMINYRFQLENLLREKLKYKSLLVVSEPRFLANMCCYVRVSSC